MSCDISLTNTQGEIPNAFPFEISLSFFQENEYKRRNIS